MSPTQLKAIAAALLLVLLLWGASELFSRGPDSVTGSLALPALTPDGVDTVAVVKGPDSIVLAKQSATAWTVNGRRAALDAVSELFQALDDSTPPELVAQDSSSFARLGVDSAGGTWLSVHGGGKPLAQLIVGRPAGEHARVYVRRSGDGHVYLWRGRLVSLVNRSADDWRDKRIATVELDSVVAVDVERGKDRYALTRAGTAWTLNGAATDSGAVVRTLEKYRAVVATGFATPAQADSVTARRPARRLVLRGGRGTTLASLAFDSLPGGFLVRRTGGAAPGGEPGTAYRMNSWDVDGLTPESRSLIASHR